MGMTGKREETFGFCGSGDERQLSLSALFQYYITAAAAAAAAAAMLEALSLLDSSRILSRSVEREWS